MIFTALVFLIFIALYFAIYPWLPGKRAKLAFITASSYVFYGWWDERFLALIVFSTLVDYYLARYIDSTDVPGRRRAALIASVCTNLGLLGFFKYFNFFADTAAEVLRMAGFQADAVTLEILLPVGISFYTFQTMGYTIDVYRRQTRAEHDLLTYAAYVSFFPQLVAGPIERAHHLLPQLRELAPPRARQYAEGAWLLSLGYFLKVFVADNVSRSVGRAFERGDDVPIDGFRVTVAVLAFALQIYADFAGYSKIARGLAKLHGIDLMQNFNCPYFASSPADFWRRWHISLSTWLRDYLYIPLGGNRRGPGRTYVNLLATMTLGGLWHGASMLFVIWGVYHGLLLAAHRRLRRLRLAASLPVRVLRYPVTFGLVLYGWLIFRSQSVGQLGAFTASLLQPFRVPMLSLTVGPPLNGPAVDLFWIGVYVAAIGLIDALQEKHGDEFFILRYRPAVLVLASGALLLLSLVFAASPLDFVYFQF